MTKKIKSSVLLFVIILSFGTLVSSFADESSGTPTLEDIAALKGATQKAKEDAALKKAEWQNAQAKKEKAQAALEESTKRLKEVQKAAAGERASTEDVESVQREMERKQRDFQEATLQASRAEEIFTNAEGVARNAEKNVQAAEREAALSAAAHQAQETRKAEEAKRMEEAKREQLEREARDAEIAAREKAAINQMIPPLALDPENIEEARRVGSSAYANVGDAMSRTRIARDEMLGNAIRRLDPADVKKLAVTKGLQQMIQKFEEDERTMSTLSGDAYVIEALSKMDINDLSRNAQLFRDVDLHLQNSKNLKVSSETQEKIELLRDAARVAKINPFLERNVTNWSEDETKEYLRFSGRTGSEIQKKLNELYPKGKLTPEQQKAAQKTRDDLWHEAKNFMARKQKEVGRHSGEELFKEAMGAASLSLQADRKNLENRFRMVSHDIHYLEKEKIGIADESKRREIDNHIHVLRRRQENLQYALLAGTQNAPPPMDAKELAKREKQEQEILAEQRRLRMAGRDEKEIRRVADAMRAQPLSKEDKGFCATAWDVTKGIAGGTWGFVKGAGGAIGAGFKGVGKGLLEAGSFFGQHGTPIKQALFATFSALAQYQYTKKGSQNNDTQVYRGLAIALGLDMGFKGQMPRGMMEVVDPLTPFKNPPLAFQQVIGQQDEILRHVLNVGGNPASAGGFPYGAQDQLQAILESTRPGAPGSFVPGSRFPASVSSNAFPGIYDPSYTNFTGQAYNGFPPLATTPTQGAILNPNYGAGNPFVMGSGLAAIAQQTASANQGRQNLGNLVAATAAERGGIQNFRQQLQGINPPGNSLKDLIDSANQVNASGRALTGRGQSIDQVIAQGSAAFANSQMLEQSARYNTELRKLSDLNHELFEAARNFRRFDFEIQRDNDGLMAGSPRDWSKNMEARNAALLRLLDLTQKRNETMTNVALIVYNPSLYQRILQQTPTTPISPPARVSSILQFLIRPAWADVQALPSFVLGWKEILKEEHLRIEKELAKNRQEKARLLPQLSTVVAQDPDGVHEINVPVLQVEELNMKAISLQARQNLEKLKKAEDTVKVSIKMTPQEKAETEKQIEDYRFLLSQLEEEAKQCANELAKVERLQLEKRTEFEIFHHFKPKGEKLLGRTPSSL